MKFGKKKEKEMIVDSNSTRAEVPVWMGGVEIGKLIRVKGKEIQGQDHLEFWIELTVGAGIENQMKDVLMKQGLFIGRPF